MKELFTNKVFARNILVMMFVWSFASFAFFLIPFYITNMKIGDLYVSLLSSEVAELIACIVILFIN